jgi:hypothetical protein
MLQMTLHLIRSSRLLTLLLPGVEVGTHAVKSARFFFTLIMLHWYYIGPSNKYIFRVGVGDILILLTM